MGLALVYIWRNLLRNRLRTALTAAAVALPITIFVLSSAVVDGIERFLDNSARQLRLAVLQKASIVNPLPAGHREIEALEPSRTRLVSVRSLRWLGGKIENDPRPLSTLAADADTFPQTFPEYLHNPDELATWQRDRQALVIGRGIAAQFGWQVGSRVTIRPSVPPYTPMPFHVISTSEDVLDPLTCFCRRDYLEEELKQLDMPQGMVSFFFVKCATRADLEYFQRAIDGQFANSGDETLTQDEKTFMNQFITQQFDLPRNLSILSALTVLIATLAAANTMSMNFRDRLSEFAALKSIGFGHRLVWTLIQAESLAVCLTGGLLGALGPYIAFTYTPLKDFTVPLIQHLDVHPVVVGEALGIALMVGLIAAAWPSWAAARLKAVVAFRALE